MRTTGAWWLLLGLSNHHYFVLLKMLAGVGGAGFTCHLVRVKIGEQLGFFFHLVSCPRTQGVRLDGKVPLPVELSHRPVVLL